jgi:hypothetical protein
MNEWQLCQFLGAFVQLCAPLPLFLRLCVAFNEKEIRGERLCLQSHG